MLQAVVFDLDDTLLDTSAFLIPVQGTALYEKRISDPLPLMPGALENLAYLAPKYRLYLLTFGDPGIQKKKIKALGISSFFQDICVASAQANESKETYFLQLVQKHPAEQMLSIGNRKSQEIRWAKKLGLKTCWFRYGEHLEEKPSSPWDVPDFEVDHHFELVRVCRL